MSADTVLILQHVEVEKPGLILDALRDCGARVEIRNLLDEPGAAADGLPSAASLAGLVVMGGPMNADDTAAYPALRLERDLLADAVREQVPTLGICLGAQLLARALEMEVRPGAACAGGPEICWAPLEDVDRTDPVLGPLAEAPAVLHWHGDRIVPTPDARALASTGTTPCQAFRGGPAAWGLQFHLEVTPELQDDWLAEPSFAAEARAALGPDALSRLRADARAAAPALRPLAERSLSAFRDLVTARTSTAAAAH